MSIKDAKRSCAILQPHYVPWVGYFEMIDRVDLFLYHDDVDFIKGEWKNRNRIRKEPYVSEARWLTVPVMRASLYGTPLLKTKIDTTRNWQKQHLRYIDAAYHNTPYISDVIELLISVFDKNHTILADLNIDLIEAICTFLRMDFKCLRVSSLSVNGKKTNKLISICEQVNADYYLANNASSAYLEVDAFKANGITVEYQNCEHPYYTQIYKNKKLEFVAYLSILDLLCNHGPLSLEILRTGVLSYDE